VSLHFLNKQQKAVRIVWLDEAGNQHERNIAPGASRWLAKTFAGQKWLILDEYSKPHRQVITPEKSARVLIE
jgi:hypothetical protein